MKKIKRNNLKKNQRKSIFRRGDGNGWAHIKKLKENNPKKEKEKIFNI